MVGGSITGLAVATVFCKGGQARRIGLIYGTGVGLGMSYSQLTGLWSDFNGTHYKNDKAFYREVECLEQELSLRYKLK